MSKEILDAVRELEVQKGIDADVLLVALEEALGAAYRKDTQRRDLTKTAQYMQQWGQLLGLGAQADRAVAPKVSVSEGAA